MDPQDLRELIEGSRAIQQCLKGKKEILKEEQPTIDFAYSCVVAIEDIKEGEELTERNIWVKRPETGEIKAEHYSSLIGKTSKAFLKKNSQLRWSEIVA